MRSLKTLDLAGTKVRDLAPLSGLALESLDLSGSAIIDLTTLKGVPLHTLNIADTGATNLAPLAGMPLKHFTARNVKAADFSLLKGCPIETCLINGTNVADLAFLRGAPLRTLDLGGCDDARSFASIADCRTLEDLTLPTALLNLPPEDLDAITALRSLPALKKVVATSQSNPVVPAPKPAPTGRGFLGIQMANLAEANAKKLGLPDNGQSRTPGRRCRPHFQ